MVVTKITEISKAKVKIMIDEEFAFVLYKGELRSYHLCEGEEITENVYEEILQTVLPKRAKLRAMHLLKARPYTEKLLYGKLLEGGYPEAVCAEAVAYVKSFGYLNDRQYTLDYIDCYKMSKSSAQMKNTLLGKGISKELFEECLSEITEKEERDLEEEQIIALMKKKRFNPSEADFQEKQKFCAFLYRKGFQIDKIRTVLSLDIT
ncbi:MAG: RecX family transcriptional regulator [Lachnospiraceae bacterium]|nr:RecX family transcriptional regulator [Lachnospiraceae bacterium]